MKKEKKHLQISFYTRAPKIMIICCTVPEIWCVTVVINSPPPTPFPPPPKRLKNQNFKKMKKMPGNTIILHMCTKNDV